MPNSFIAIRQCCSLDMNNKTIDCNRGSPIYYDIGIIIIIIILLSTDVSYKNAETGMTMAL